MRYLISLALFINFVAQAAAGSLTLALLCVVVAALVLEDHRG